MNRTSLTHTQSHTNYESIYLINDFDFHSLQKLLSLRADNFVY